jgi:hypothetical protein
MMYRFLTGLTSNVGDLNGSNLSSLIPATNSLRKQCQSGAPFADCLTFLISATAISTSMMGVPMAPLMSDKPASTPKPWRDRKRGIMGSLCAVFTAVEISQAGKLHAHSKAYSPMSWHFLEWLAEYKQKNKDFGLFMDSIISNELTHKRSFNVHPRPPFPDPKTIHIRNEDFPLPTVSTLPMASHMHLPSGGTLTNKVQFNL